MEGYYALYVYFLLTIQIIESLVQNENGFCLPQDYTAQSFVGKWMDRNKQYQHMIQEQHKEDEDHNEKVILDYERVLDHLIGEKKSN